MSRGAARFTHVTWLLIAATGALLTWMAFVTNDDPFSVDNHPWQSTVRAAHILGAPLFVFAIGLIWNGHVQAKLRSGQRPRRRTGVTLVLLSIATVVSGYVLQVAVAETLHESMFWTHLLTGCALIPIYLVHQLLPGGRWRGRASESS